MTMKSWPVPSSPPFFPGTIRSIPTTLQASLCPWAESLLGGAGFGVMWLGTSDFFMGTLLSKNGNDSGILVGCIMLLSMEKNYQTWDGLRCYYQILSNMTLSFETWRNNEIQTIWNNMKQYETCVFWLLSKIVDLKITRLWSFDQDAEFTITIGTLPFDGTTIMFNNHYPSLP